MLLHFKEITNTSLCWTFSSNFSLQFFGPPLLRQISAFMCSLVGWKKKKQERKIFCSSIKKSCNTSLKTWNYLSVNVYNRNAGKEHKVWKFQIISPPLNVSKIEVQCCWNFSFSAFPFSLFVIFCCQVFCWRVLWLAVCHQCVVLKSLQLILNFILFFVPLAKTPLSIVHSLKFFHCNSFCSILFLSFITKLTNF